MIIICFRFIFLLLYIIHKFDLNIVFYIDYQITLKKKKENITLWNNKTKENDFFFNNNFLKYNIIRKAIYRMTQVKEIY